MIDVVIHGSFKHIQKKNLDIFIDCIGGLSEAFPALFIHKIEK